MKTFMRKGLLLVAAFTLVIAAKAQEAASKVWSLEDCITYAIENNLQMKQKRLATEISKVDVEAKKGALLPTVSASTGQNMSWRPWSKSYVNITDGTFNSTSSEINYNGTYGVQAQYTLWNGGRNKRQVERSRLSVEQSEIDERSTELSLQEQIVQLYVQILYQAEAVDVNRQILASTRVLADRAREMHEVGTLSRADLAQMQAQVSQEEYNVANALTQLNTSKLQLRQILQLPSDTEFDVKTPQINETRLTAAIPSASQVYDVSQSLRPEIRYYRLGIQAADVDIDIARRGKYPSVGVSAGINSSASSGMHNNFGTQLRDNLSNSVGLNVTLPIFDGHQTRSNVAKAQLDRENAQLALELQLQQLRNDIDTYWLNAGNSTSQYSAAKVNVEGMRESYELVSEQFAVGLKDISDLTTGKNNLLQAEQQLLQAKYTNLLNRSLLDFYAGLPFDF